LKLLKPKYDGVNRPYILEIVTLILLPGIGVNQVINSICHIRSVGVRVAKGSRNIVMLRNGWAFSLFRGNDLVQFGTRILILHSSKLDDVLVKRIWLLKIFFRISNLKVTTSFQTNILLLVTKHSHILSLLLITRS
jgi:hypothetical protein